MPRLDPKEKWERRRENWKSRESLHAEREKNLAEFAAEAAPAEEAERNAQVMELLVPAKLPPAICQATKLAGRSGDVAVTLNVSGRVMEFSFRFRDLTGTYPLSRLNHADLREMLAQALNTISRLE